MDNSLVTAIITGYLYIADYLKSNILPYILPAGGLNKQALCKNSDIAGDYKFKTIAIDGNDGDLVYKFSYAPANLAVTGNVWTTISSIPVTVGTWSLWAYASTAVIVSGTTRQQQLTRIVDSLGVVHAYTNNNGNWVGPIGAVERTSHNISNLLVTVHTDMIIHFEVFTYTDAKILDCGSVSGTDSLNYGKMGGNQNFLSAIKIK